MERIITDEARKNDVTIAKILNQADEAFLDKDPVRIKELHAQLDGSKSLEVSGSCRDELVYYLDMMGKYLQ